MFFWNSCCFDDPSNSLSWRPSVGTMDSCVAWAWRLWQAVQVQELSSLELLVSLNIQTLTERRPALSKNQQVSCGRVLHIGQFLLKKNPVFTSSGYGFAFPVLKHVASTTLWRLTVVWSQGYMSPHSIISVQMMHLRPQRCGNGTIAWILPVTLHTIWQRPSKPNRKLNKSLEHSAETLLYLKEKKKKLHEKR